MSGVTVGDLSQVFAMRRQTYDIKTALERASYEVTTGQTQDLASAVGGDFAPIAAIDHARKALASYAQSNAEATNFVSGVQNALVGLENLSSDMGSSFLLVAQAQDDDRIEVLASDARGRFGSAVAILNTRFAGQSLFSGAATDQAALNAPDVILEALKTEVAGLTSGTEIAARVTAWFEADDGFSAVGYAGAQDGRAPLQVGPNDQVDFSLTAQNSALRAHLAGYAMAALMDEGILAGNPAARASLMASAGTAMLSADNKLAALRADVGGVEARLELAATRITAEDAGLQTARDAIAAVDPYAAAAALQSTQTQLESLFAITARLSRLNLTEFLR